MVSQGLNIYLSLEYAMNSVKTISVHALGPNTAQERFTRWLMMKLKLGMVGAMDGDSM